MLLDPRGNYCLLIVLNWQLSQYFLVSQILYVCIKCGIMADISIDIATDYLLITLLSVNLKRGVIKLRLDDLGLVDNALVGQPL